MKEEEAKKKWCPHNLGQEMAVESGKCIGSDCMMWVPIPRYTIDGYPINDSGDCGLKSKGME